MPAVDMEATGRNIRKMMETAGKSVRDIRTACGFSTGNAVYKWMNGVCMPTIDNMVIIADVCGVTINDIIAVRRT